MAVGATLVADPASAFERRGDKKILVLVGREQVQIMDPSIKYDAKTRLMQQAMYDGLAKYVGNPPVITPWLATSWDVSDDGLTYTFHLADKAKFHNGDPVTAAAVKWSFERTLKLGKGPSWMLNEVLTPDNIKVIGTAQVGLGLSSVAETSDQGFGMGGNDVPALFFGGQMKPRMVAKSFAPCSDRKPPEIFCLSFAMRTSCSA